MFHLCFRKAVSVRSDLMGRTGKLSENSQKLSAHRINPLGICTPQADEAPTSLQFYHIKRAFFAGKRLLKQVSNVSKHKKVDLFGLHSLP